MTIEYLKRNEIDDQQWNHCIKNAIHSLPYAYTFYLDVVAPNWSALVAEDYSTVMPLPTRKKYWLQYVFQPIPCPQLGVFSLQELNSNDIAYFYQTIPTFIKYLNYGVHSSSFHKNFGRFIINDNYELPLNRSYEELLMNYKYNCRRSVKLALKKNIHFENQVDHQAIIDLLKSSKQQKIAQLNHQLSTQLVQLMDILVRQNIGFSIGIRDEHQQLCAAVFYIKDAGRIINLINASNQIAHKNSWMKVLIDRLIKNHAGENIILDFEGSNIPSIATFFKKFGAEKTSYYVWNWNRLPFGLKWLKTNNIYFK